MFQRKSSISWKTHSAVAIAVSDALWAALPVPLTDVKFSVTLLRCRHNLIRNVPSGVFLSFFFKRPCIKPQRCFHQALLQYWPKRLCRRLQESKLNYKKTVGLPRSSKWYIRPNWRSDPPALIFDPSEELEEPSPKELKHQHSTKMWKKSLAWYTGVKYQRQYWDAVQCPDQT